MQKILLDPKLIKFTLKFLLKAFVFVVVVGAMILMLIKFEIIDAFRDTSAGIFQYDRTYAELAHTGLDLMIADTEANRVKGLSGFSDLRDNQGMLFVFDEEGEHGFWMKDMRFSIDIMWMNEYYEIIHIEENVKPESYPRIYGSGVMSKFVLEMPAGFVEENDVRVGDVLQVL